MTTKTELPKWEDLPLRYGEDSREWNNNMARYSHIGCPGVQYEDNCAAPWDCAVRGSCRIAYENMRQHVRNQPVEDCD
jgi:hypothetical protein